MKVRQLKRILEELTNSFLGSEEWEVVLSKDAEGNSFSPLSEFSSCLYEPENSYSGDISYDVDDDECNAICLWPTN